MQRLKFNYIREEKVKYISHLEIMRSFHRAIRRAKLPVALSQGFNPQLRMSIALPLAVGVTAENEMAEVYMDKDTEPKEFQQRLNASLSEGIKIFNTGESSPDAPQLMQLVDAALYHIKPFKDIQKIPKGFFYEGVESIIREDRIIVWRKAKKKNREFDIRPFIINMEVFNDNERECLKMFLQTGSRGGAKPAEVLAFMGKAMNCEELSYSMQIHRTGLFNKKSDNDYELLS